MADLIHQMLHNHGSLEALMFLVFVIIGAVVAYVICAMYEDDRVSRSTKILKDQFIEQLKRRMKWEL